MPLEKGALLSPHLGAWSSHRLPLLGSWEVRDALLMHQHLLISSCQLSSEALSTTDCEVALAVRYFFRRTLCPLVASATLRVVCSVVVASVRETFHHLLEL
jgi:hypothetical protein